MDRPKCVRRLQVSGDKHSVPRDVHRRIDIGSNPAEPPGEHLVLGARNGQAHRGFIAAQSLSKLRPDHELPTARFFSAGIVVHFPRAARCHNKAR